MPKGYWIVHERIDDPQRFEAYRAAVMAPLAAHSGRFLVRGGTHETPEGEAKPRSIVVEFPSYDAALTCYHSNEYQAVIELRRGISEIDFVIVEGHDG